MKQYPKHIYIPFDKNGNLFHTLEEEPNAIYETQTEDWNKIAAGYIKYTNEDYIPKWHKPILEELKINKDYYIIFYKTPSTFVSQAKYKGDGKFMIGLNYVFQIDKIKAIFEIPEYKDETE